MRFRDYLQENSIDIGTSGTKTFNLDYNSPITQLDLYFKATNDAGGNVEFPFERGISKIEIVDGGKVLWDLPGEVALAAFVHDNEGFPYSEAEEAANASVRQQIPIRFGLKLFDTVYAFDPRKHANPQLKFTFDEATYNTPGTDGYVSDSWEFSLMVRLMEGAPVPKGFLSNRIVESFTSVGTGDRRVEMPTDRVIRYLMCRAAKDDTTIYSIITNYKLSQNGGEFVPFDLASRDFINRMCESFKPITRRFTGYITSGDVRETFVGIPHNGQLTHDVNGCIASGNFYINGSVLVYRRFHDGSITVPGMCYISNTGWALHDTLIYPFGDRMNPAHWLDPMALRKLDWFLNDQVSGADVDVCVQQVYKY